MKTRSQLAVTFGVLSLGTFSILGGAYTHAQQLAQARPTTSAIAHRTDLTNFTLCLHEDTGECIRTFGAGNGVQIWNSNHATFHVVNTRSGGQRQIADTAGTCLRGFADGSVGLASGGCDSSTDAEWWIRSEDSSGRITYKSSKYGGFMGTLGTANGIVVSMETNPQPGFYWGWFECC